MKRYREISIIKIVSANLFLLIFLLISTSLAYDHETEVNDRLIYCDMVKIWSMQKESGIPENERIGWPPYDGNCL